MANKHDANSKHKQGTADCGPKARNILHAVEASEPQKAMSLLLPANVNENHFGITNPPCGTT